jgi:hypothetical protein
VTRLLAGRLGLGMQRAAVICLLCGLVTACRPAVEYSNTITPIPPSATLARLIPTVTPRLLPTGLPASSPTITPTPRLQASSTPTHGPVLTRTSTPSPQASLTPTLGPLMTRTPSSPERCPEWKAGVTFDSDFDIEHIELAILGYLNAGGNPAKLESLLSVTPEPEPSGNLMLSVSVYAEDLTGDGVVDYAMQVDAATEEDATRTLLILSCREGLFEIAFVDRFPGYKPLIAALLGVIDLNGNGVPEVVYTVLEFGAGADSTRTVIPMEWEGTSFLDLVSLKDPADSFFDSGASMYNLLRLGEQAFNTDRGDLTRMFPDIDGNGTREILLTGGVSGRYWTMGGGPKRPWTDTWMWNGEAFTLHSTEFEPPEYRFQAIRDGDAATLRGEYEKALAFYQQAVFDEALIGWNPERLYAIYNAYFMGTPTPLPMPEERPRLNAYGRYRILLLHTVQGNDQSAEIVYATLQDKFPEGNPGYPYAVLAEAFWHGFQASGDIAAGCELARSFAEEHAEEVLTPLGSSIYGFFYEDYASADICPFE